MANPNNIKIRSELGRPLSIAEMDTNFDELRDLINKYNGYTGADFFDTFTDRGDWAATTSYDVKDLVRYSGAVYLCFEAHTSDITFEAQYWKLWQGKYNRQANSLAEIKTFGGFRDFDIVSCLSFSEPRKGQWVWKSDSTLEPNDLDVIKVDAITVGRWIHQDLLSFNRDYHNIDVVLGHKKSIGGSEFAYYDYIDMILGRVHDETATSEEIELVNNLNITLGIIGD